MRHLYGTQFMTSSQGTRMHMEDMSSLPPLVDMASFPAWHNSSPLVLLICSMDGDFSPIAEASLDFFI